MATASPSPFPDDRLCALFGVTWPIVQAPMAGSTRAAMAVAVSRAGGLGSLPCGMLDAQGVRAEVSAIRRETSKPVNLNFIVSGARREEPEREDAWRRHLSRYAAELGVAPGAPARSNRAAFDAAMCDVVTELAPEVVSFHFGLPEAALVERVRAAGAKIVSSATTVAEARWLEDRGCDAIIAQGAEAGGHRGMFLTEDIATQVGTMALVPQVVDAVSVPVIAAGGIADARGIVAALALGAAGVQLGTAYLFCAEATVNPLYARALQSATDDSTVLTNVFTGRPARGIENRFVREVGPMSPLAPTFPAASIDTAPLRAQAEARGSADFSPLWAGQAARLSPARETTLGAGELTTRLATDALARLQGTHATGTRPETK